MQFFNHKTWIMHAMLTYHVAKQLPKKEKNYRPDNTGEWPCTSIYIMHDYYLLLTFQLGSLILESTVIVLSACVNSYSWV